MPLRKYGVLADRCPLSRITPAAKVSFDPMTKEPERAFRRFSKRRFIGCAAASKTVSGARIRVELSRRTLGVEQVADFLGLAEADRVRQAMVNLGERRCRRCSDARELRRKERNQRAGLGAKPQTDVATQ